jgi:hypothetical protein
METENKDISILLLDLIDLGRNSFKKEEDENCQKLLDMVESLYRVFQSKTANVDCQYQPLIINKEIVTESSSYSKGLIIWSLLLRRLVLATTTKPNLGYLAPASEAAGKHTLPF